MFKANDVAVLTLSSPVNYTSTISPVCLPPPLPSNSQSQYDNYEAAIVGWGTTSAGKCSSIVTAILNLIAIFHLTLGGSISNVLQQATVKTMTNSKCRESYGGIINSGMLCAASPGKDTCQVIQSTGRFHENDVK